MAYADVHEAIVGVLQASGLTGIDWTRSPAYIEAGEQLPDQPFPYVVYEMPMSEVEHQMGSDPMVINYRPSFFVVALQSQRNPWLSPFVAGGVVAYLDSLRGTDALPAGYQAFSGANYECIKFVRDGDYLAKFANRSPFDMQTGKAGERVWMLQADYTLQITKE